MRREEAELECRVRLMPYGIDVEIIRGGAPTVTRTFETDTEALAWAESKRAARQGEGWHVIPPDPESSHASHM